MRALAWKEWREQRGVVLAGLATAICLPLIAIAGSALSARGVDIPGSVELLPAAFAFLLWPLFGAACGASTIAGEIGEETLGFLLSRPVTRARIWAIKVASGLAGFGAIVAGSLVVGKIFGLATGAAGSQAFLSAMLEPFRFQGPQGLAVASALLLLFSASVFFSTLVSRAMTAAAAGLALSLLILAGIVLYWSRMDLVPRFEPELLAADILLAALLVLLGSRYLFVRGELLRGEGVRGRVVLASLTILGAGALAAIPLIQAQLRLTPANAVLESATVSPGGDAVIAIAATPTGGSSQVWAIHPDGSGFTRVTGRLATSAAISPDGEWVGYLSHRGALGFAAELPALRIVRPSGVEDRLIAANLPLGIDDGDRVEVKDGYLWIPPRLIFSPDGSKIAILGRWKMVVVSVDGASLETFPDPDPAGGSMRPYGWTADSRGIVLVPFSIPRERPVVIVLDVHDGGTRELRFDGSSLVHPYRISPPSSGVTVWPVEIPVNQEGVSMTTLGLLSLKDGTMTLIGEYPCVSGANLSDDGSAMAWIECDGAGDGSRTSRAHLVDLETMTDSVLGSFEGRSYDVELSPSGRRMLFRRGGVGLPAIVMDDEGRTRGIEAGWYPLGWSGGGRIIVRERGGGRLGVMDVDSGAIRTFYPPEGS
jgi:hypothetical protein